MSDIPNNLSGSRRSLVDAGEKATLEAAGGLVIDPERSRPQYFDGRFLAAKDLTDDQTYMLRRLSDYGRAAGSGVITGLEVLPGRTGGEVVIRQGHGITPAGESTVLARTLTVNLLRLRPAELYDGQLGLRRRNDVRSRNRTGVFVVALRPIEYTANPRRTYPAEVHGERKIEDHDTIEATAVTLVPWPGSWSGGAEEARRRLARDIFVLQSGRGIRSDLLPLAMVYIDRAGVSWIDMELIRRPVGADRGDVLGLGVSSRAVRAAHVRQYNRHLRELLSSGVDASLAAADHFDALPPVGELPAGAVDRAAFTQSFFPAEMDIDISFVPDDELPLIVEESLVMPPIDLQAGQDVTAATAVLVLVPVPRAELRKFRATLDALEQDIRRSLLRRVQRVPTVRTPLLALSRLRLPQVVTSSETSDTDAATSAWSTLLNRALESLGSEAMFWYVRRRNHNYRGEIEGDVVMIDVTPQS
ncbi:MAG: hypothetical protein H6741_02390 [Alphaproteobacteria bacterium]|nr:hypothetical protein [Alphaproteobacteria bacterium]MCB9791553.1 hypothetical protein [Alphaproteobacteria bacterium]